MTKQSQLKLHVTNKLVGKKERKKKSRFGSMGMGLPKLRWFGVYDI